MTLVWKYEARDDIFFEVYRSTKDKDACNERTKVGVVGENKFTDQDLNSSTNYHYTIRAVNKTTGYKSPFAPIVKVRTWLEDDEFFKLIFASKSGTGYVGENTEEQNRSHFALGIKNRVVEWNSDVELIVKYIEKRRTPVAQVENFKISKENKMIKLSWDKV